jgi:hypothetical protein
MIVLAKAKSLIADRKAAITRRKARAVAAAATTNLIVHNPTVYGVDADRASTLRIRDQTLVSTSFSCVCVPDRLCWVDLGRFRVHSVM